MSLLSQSIQKGISLVDPEQPGKRWAIVIGINKYMNSSIKELEKAQNDAIDLSNQLNNSGEFDYVFTFTDKSQNIFDPLFPMKNNILAKIDTVLREANENDFVLFYFSGHGISDPNGNGYLVAIDTQLDDPFTTGIKIDDIVAKIQAKGIKRNLLILDACREVINKETKSLNQIGLKEKKYDEAVISAIFYSTGSGYYSHEHNDFSNGVYTHFLLQGMKGEADADNNGIVTISELEQYVQAAVNDWGIKNNKQQKPFTKVVKEKYGDIGLTKSPIKKIEAEDKSNSNTNIVLGPRIKSVILPGWGQYSNGEKWKGSFTFISFCDYRSFDC